MIPIIMKPDRPATAAIPFELPGISHGIGHQTVPWDPMALARMPVGKVSAR